MQSIHHFFFLSQALVQQFVGLHGQFTFMHTYLQLWFWSSSFFFSFATSGKGNSHSINSLTALRIEYIHMKWTTASGNSPLLQWWREKIKCKKCTLMVETIHSYMVSRKNRGEKNIKVGKEFLRMLGKGG